MNNWNEIHELLTGSLADFLAEILPDVGGQDWWRNYVIAQLTTNQARAVSALDEGELRGLVDRNAYLPTWRGSRPSPWQV